MNFIALLVCLLDVLFSATNYIVDGNVTVFTFLCFSTLDPDLKAILHLAVFCILTGKYFVSINLCNFP